MLIVNWKGRGKVSPEDRVLTSIILHGFIGGKFLKILKK